MKVRKIFFIVATILLGMRSASAQFTVSGFVKDAKTGEVLVGAHVYDSLSGSGVCTNNYGYFSLSSKQQSAIQISFIGYHKQNIVLVLKSDTVINIAISEGNEIDEVLVRANKRIAFNTTTLCVKELERMPSLGSKPDILKAMQLLPGIQGQSEGTSLLLVRGGSPGENLYLLDHTPLIYVNHLGGVTSVFNPDMINSISIYKGGFPAEYGGKLSSVVNIAQRSGSQSNIKGSFSIGLLDASLLLEGPLSNKASFIFTGRTTLFGLLFYGYTSLAEFNEYKMYYGYHDMNGKITWSPNYKNNLYFNIYQGDDYLSFKSKPESIMQNADSKLKNTCSMVPTR